MNDQRSKRSLFVALLAGCLAMLFAILCVSSAVGLYLWYELREEPTPYPTEIIVQITPTPTPRRPTATPKPRKPTATPTPLTSPTPTILAFPRLPNEIEQEPISKQRWEDLARIWQLDQPYHDYVEAAQRFDVAEGEATTFKQPPAKGEIRTFILDEETTIEAKLAEISANAYWWMQVDYEYDSAELREVVTRFEEELYPKTTTLFGPEPRPGIDEDPHISFVHLAGELPTDDLGYFDSANQYPLWLDENSNEQEMLFMNMEELEMGDDLYYGTLVHELQHLIMWQNDPNEAVWVDEGISQLTELYNGFETANANDYLSDPSLQLNTWDYDDNEVYAHYAASYLFFAYFWEQLGTEAVQTFVKDSADGFVGVRNALQTHLPNTSLEQFLTDWMVANWLDDYEKDPRYGYDLLDINQPRPEERLRDFPYEVIADIPQYGVHYLSLRESGEYTISFAGNTLTELLPVEASSGNRVWYAPPYDLANSQLTHAVDLRETTSPSLSFQVWHDLEQDYDYGYVFVSADNGEKWYALNPDLVTRGDYGAGFTGENSKRNQWSEYTLSLQRFRGEEILLRFELFTDGALSEGGLALDQIAISETDFSDDAEDGYGDWSANGFVPVGRYLPQQWSVMVILDHDEIELFPITLDQLNRGQLTLTLPAGGRATIAIMPQTPFSLDTTTYWLQVEKE